MYSLTFRRHLLKIGEKEGLSIRGMASRFAIASRTIVNWKRKLEPVLKRKRKPFKLNEEAFLKDVKDYPDAYGYERGARLKVSTSCIRYHLKRLKISYTGLTQNAH